MKRPLSAYYAMLTSFSISLLALIYPVVRTPLLYTPNLLPDNFTITTTYSLLDAHAEYGAFSYKESGTVLKVESYNDHTRNSSFGYNHQQTFSGVTCTYHVHTNVTGYDSDGTPQSDLYPELDAPGCGMAVAFRGLLITLFIVPWLSSGLLTPLDLVNEAAAHHDSYSRQLAEVGGDNYRGEGQPAALDEPPSASHLSAPPPYDCPGWRIDTGDIAVPVVPLPPPPPAYQQPVQPPPRPRMPLSRANSERAKAHLRREGDALHAAARSVPVALLAVSICLTLSLGSIVCLFGYVNDSGMSEQREVLWPVWLYVPTMSIYVLLVLIETASVLRALVVAVYEYLEHDNTNWRVVFRGSPPFM